MPDYYNMPYKYRIEIKNPISKDEKPILNFYYTASSENDLEPIVTFYNDELKDLDLLVKMAIESYMEKGIDIDNYLVCNSNMLHILNSMKNNSTPLIDFVFDRIEKNSKYIYGEF